MDDRTITQRLYNTGHFWNPAKPDAMNVGPSDLAVLRRSDRPFIQAVESFQESDANMSVLSMLRHRRTEIADGDVGPATMDLLTMPRCPLPDFAPPENAMFYYDDPELQRAVETMQEHAKYMESPEAFGAPDEARAPGEDEAERPVGEATGSGSWPFPGCDPEGPRENHSIRISLDISRCPNTIKAYLDKALDAVVKAYAEIGLAVRYIKEPTNDCEIRKLFQNLAGSVIGWNEFPQPGTCRQVINGRLDTGYAPSDYRYWANLEAHETGHGVGLNHGRGSIMNPSILLVWPLRWVGTYSYANLRRWFGGKPIGPVTPPPPPGPAVPPAFEGEFRGEALDDGSFALRGSSELVVTTQTKPGRYRYHAVPGSNEGSFKFTPVAEA